MIDDPSTNDVVESVPPSVGSEEALPGIDSRAIQSEESPGTVQPLPEEIPPTLGQQDSKPAPEQEADTRAISHNPAREQGPNHPEMPEASQTMEEPRGATERRRSSVRRGGGAKTAQGKRRSKYNALRWGFFAGEGAIETPFYRESKREYRRLFREFMENLDPRGAVERVQVEIMAMQLLNYRRLKNVEQALILERHTPLPTNADATVAELAIQEWAQQQEGRGNSESCPPGRVDEASQLLTRMKKKLAEEDARRRAERARIDVLRKSLPNPDDFDWVQQCEGHILRQYYRAGAELERLQRMRLRLPLPPTVKVDVSRD